MALCSIHVDIHTYRSVFWPAVISEAFFCSRQEHMQSLTTDSIQRTRRFGALSPKWHVSIKASPQGSGNLVGGKRPKEPKRMEGRKGIGFLSTPSWCTYELTDAVAACTALAPACARWSPGDERSRHKPPPLTQKLSPTNNHCKWKLSFLQGSLTVDRNHA